MKRTTCILAIWAVIAATPYAAHAGDRVAIRSTQNGLYVRAGVGPQTQLAAVSPRVFPHGWEAFEWIRYGATGNFSLRSLLNGQIVSVGSDGMLRANVPIPPNGIVGNRADVVFEFVPLENGDFAIRSVLNGRYVRAGIGPNTLLGATSTHIPPQGWERFRREFLGN